MNGRRSASSYGRVRVARERAGTPISPLDALIAAHVAVALGAAVVTVNVRDARCRRAFSERGGVVCRSRREQKATRSRSPFTIRTFRLARAG